MLGAGLFAAGGFLSYVLAGFPSATQLGLDWGALLAGAALALAFGGVLMALGLRDLGAGRRGWRAGILVFAALVLLPQGFFALEERALARMAAEDPEQHHALERGFPYGWVELQYSPPDDYYGTSGGMWILD